MLDAGRRTWEAVEAIEVAGGTSAGGLKRLRMSLTRLKSTDKCSETGAKRTALSPARSSATPTPESQL